MNEDYGFGYRTMSDIINLDFEISKDDYKELRAAACSLGYLDINQFIQDQLKNIISSLWDEGILSNQMVSTVESRMIAEKLL